MALFCSNLVLSSTASAETFVMEKRNHGFSIDGNNGSANGRQVYLWTTDTNNKNQQWVETTVDSRYKQYQKLGTNHCLDGGRGAENYQIVYLWQCSPTNRNQHWEKIPQANGHFRLKKRGFSFSIDGNRGASKRQGLYLYRSADSNVNQHWKFISTDGGFGLDPNAEPWENFDLTGWALDAPNVDPSDGLSARTSDEDFANGELFPGSEPYFYTGFDGAMVFKSIVGGAKTSANTSYPRSELREMLRKGDTSVSTKGITENNWALGYQPTNLDIGFDASNDNAQAIGGRGGKLAATMRVNHVTTTGDSGQVGRVIIGQIHADNDEPLRLYYRKLPNNSLGSVYFAHEIRDGDDIEHQILVGSSSSSASNPSDGIALGELFSYEIINEGATIEVILREGDRDGPIIGQASIDMNEENSGYDRADEWMYFKAGAYTQNNTGDADDYDEVAIYRLENTH
ncbi:hypothetical protein EOL70_02685 [Leucothrix sargassi]|nr:hypothetical protein EOL70_02685 [Leucothrix sargassi]